MISADDFYRTFANIPLAERKNPIYTDQEYGAMSWLVVKLEIDAGTKIGMRALEFLSREQLI